MPLMGSHIGTLIKPYGFKGELVLRGKAGLIKKLEKGIPLFIEIDEQGIPFFIEDLSLDASGEKCIIKFEFIQSDLEARKYVNCAVYTEQSTKNEGSSEMEIGDYIGFTVIDISTGDKYAVEDFYPSAENPILVLEKDGQEVLLPGNANYILSVNSSEKIIEAEFPEGLILE